MECNSLILATINGNNDFYVTSTENFQTRSLFINASNNVMMWYKVDECQSVFADVGGSAAIKDPVELRV